MKSLSASVEQKSKANLYWRYTAVKQDGAGVIGATGTTASAKGVHDVQYSLPVNGSNPGLNTSSNPITFSAGKWTFRLYAFEELGVTDAAKYIYYTDAENEKIATVSAGKTVTVNVSVTGVSTGEGKIKLTDITIPDGYSNVKLQCRVDNSVNWDAMTVSDSKWSKDYGTDTFACGQSHTVEVGLFTDDSNSTFISSATITVSVYRGLYTIVSGSYDELTGGVILNSDIPKPVVTSVSKTADEGHYPGAVVELPKAAPGDSTSSTTTTVQESTSLKKDSSSSAITVAAGDDVKTEVTVVAYDTDAAEAKFGASSGNTIVAALDVTMTVSVTHENVTTSTNVTLFDPAVVVETNIGTGLSNITMKSRKDGASADDEWEVKDTVEELYDSGVPKAYRFNYNSTSGVLTFTTDHFSEFQIIIPVYSKIVETGKKFQTLAAAFAAVQEGETIQLLDDCATGTAGQYSYASPLVLSVDNVTLDLNDKTITTMDNFTFVVAGSNVTVKNGTIQSYEKRNAQNQDDQGGAYYRGYPLVVAKLTKDEIASNVKVDDVTIYGGISAGGSTEGSATNILGSGEVTLTNCIIEKGAAYALCSQLASTLNVVSGSYSKGGTTASALASQEAAKDVTAGHYNASKISITGGTFNDDPTTWVATGYVATQSGDTWTVGKAVASITKSSTMTYYASLASAVNAATSGDTIDLLANITLTADITVGKVLTIEKDSYTLTEDTYAVKADDGYVRSNDGTQIKITEDPSVAKIGATKYATLEAAVAAAGNTATITIIKDFTQENVLDICKALTINKNGHTITNDSNIQAHTNAGYKLTKTDTQIIITSLIKMNLVADEDGLAPAFNGALSGGDEVYRVLKRIGDGAGTGPGDKVLVMAMYETGCGSAYYSSSVKQVLFDNGSLYTRYSGSSLDDYFEKTFYSNTNLTSDAFSAIVPVHIKQSSWKHDSGTPSGVYTHGYQWLYSGSTSECKAQRMSEVAVGTVENQYNETWGKDMPTVTGSVARHVYALDLDDIYEYFGKSDGGSITLDDVLVMFYTSNKGSTNGPWLRTASGGNASGDSMAAWQLVAKSSMAGFTTYAATTNFVNDPAYCPAFVIDLSKLSTWTTY